MKTTTHVPRHSQTFKSSVCNGFAFGHSCLCHSLVISAWSFVIFLEPPLPPPNRIPPMKTSPHQLRKIARPARIGLPSLQQSQQAVHILLIPLILSKSHLPSRRPLRSLRTLRNLASAPLSLAPFAKHTQHTSPLYVDTRGLFVTVPRSVSCGFSQEIEFILTF
jgi:hypothetical protein